MNTSCGIQVFQSCPPMGRSESIPFNTHASILSLTPYMSSRDTRRCRKRGQSRKDTAPTCPHDTFIKMLFYLYIYICFAWFLCLSFFKESRKISKGTSKAVLYKSVASPRIAHPWGEAVVVHGHLLEVFVAVKGLGEPSSGRHVAGQELRQCEAACLSGIASEPGQRCLRPASTRGSRADSVIGRR